jgi:hypothetical protein
MHALNVMSLPLLMYVLMRSSRALIFRPVLLKNDEQNGCGAVSVFNI